MEAQALQMPGFLTQSQARVLALVALRSATLKCQAADHKLPCILQVEHVKPRSISYPFARMAATLQSPHHHLMERICILSTPLQHSQRLARVLLPILSHYPSQSTTAFAILHAAEQISSQYKAQLAASLSDETCSRASGSKAAAGVCS